MKEGHLNQSNDGFNQVRVESAALNQLMLMLMFESSDVDVDV